VKDPYAGDSARICAGAPRTSAALPLRGTELVAQRDSAATAAERRYYAARPGGRPWVRSCLKMPLSVDESMTSGRGMMAAPRELRATNGWGTREL